MRNDGRDICQLNDISTLTLILGGKMSKQMSKLKVEEAASFVAVRRSSKAAKMIGAIHLTLTLTFTMVMSLTVTLTLIHTCTVAVVLHCLAVASAWYLSTSCSRARACDWVKVRDIMRSHAGLIIRH